MIFKSILKLTSAKLSFGSTSKTQETDPSLIANARHETAPANSPSGIDAKQIKRLGFMEGEGRVPDDFNTMSAREIDNLFLNDR